MAEWEHLIEGLDINERDGSIPAELVERLDLVYSNGDPMGNPSPLYGVSLQHSVQNIGGVVVEIRKILEPKITPSAVKVTISYGGTSLDGTERTEVVRKMRTPEGLDDLFIFGAILESGLRDFAATPIFCLGEKPRGVDAGHLGYKRYQGLYPVGRSDSLIGLDKEVWNGAIKVYPDGRASVYVGSACGGTLEAVMFDELIPFDLEKRLILVRSPNGSMDFDGLHILQLSEGDNKFDYDLVYGDVKAMRDGKTWAVNYLDKLDWEDNTHLDVYTREE